MSVRNMRSVRHPASRSVDRTRVATQYTSAAHAALALDQCLQQPKMADGLLCTEDATAGNVRDKTLVKTCESGDECATVDTRTGAGANTPHFSYSNGGILQELCPSASSPFNLDIAAVPVSLVSEEIMQPCSPNTEEDCRKKRCVDRYDSSESSDSGVAVLSCTDCSGSSTASSDITDPGSPYSTASNHSDQDSNSNPIGKPPPPAQHMPPTTHHPPWHWAEESSPPLKRPPPNQPQVVVTSTPLLLPKQTVCMNNNKIIPTSESLLKTIVANSKAKMQQGKITEYFKSHHKAKEFRTTREKKHQVLTRTGPPPGKVAIEKLTKPRKAPTISTPRKILPAPSKQQPPTSAANLTNITNLAAQFPTQTMTLTTLTLQQQQQQFIPQFANQFMHHHHHPHHQGLSGGYIKINVPIVKLNAIPTTLDAASPTVRALATSQMRCLTDVSSVVGPNASLSLTGSPLPPNVFTTSSANIGSITKRKSSCSSNSSNTVETISSPLTSTLLLTPSTLATLANSGNNFVTTIATASSTQPSISVSDTSSKTSTSSTLLCTETTPSSSTSISNVKELSTSANQVSRTPINITNNNSLTSPIVLLQNEPSIINKLTNKAPQDNALKAAQTISNTSTVKDPINIECGNNNNSLLNKNETKEDTETSGTKQNNTSITTAEVAAPTASPINCNSARSSPVHSEDSGISSSTCLTLPPELDAPSSDTPPCQKSPILSVPKTIRFPAAAGTVLCSSASSSQQQQLLSNKGLLLKKRKLNVSSANGVENGASSRSGGVCSAAAEKRQVIGSGEVGAACMWSECHAQFDASGALLEHLQIKHVISQATCEHYVCLWQGCKVHGRKSCSRSWLERHVLAHAGTKPFRCIVDGCGMRFNSQLTLQRHVNGHFNGDQNQNGTSKKSVENALKLYKRNGKKIRFRRQPWSARMFDFIDASIMEGLQYQLVKMTEKRTLGQFDCNVGNTAVLQVQVLGRRVALDGVRQLLVRYHPKDIVSDEWIKESEFSDTKTVTISMLNSSAKTSLQESLFSTSDIQTNPRQSKKHKRKPIVLKPT